MSQATGGEQELQRKVERLEAALRVSTAVNHGLTATIQAMTTNHNRHIALLERQMQHLELRITRCEQALGIVATPAVQA